VSSWWDSLTALEREELKEELHRALYRDFRSAGRRPDYEAEEAERYEYARWFVREHFLRSDYEAWRARTPDTMNIEFYRRCVAGNGVDWTWPDRTDPNYRTTRSYFVNIADLEADEIREDLPPTSQEGMVHALDIVTSAREDYRTGKQAYNDDATWRWLIAEAEYLRVYHEALVRSYGVDVKAP
jgi:hypothetical protein